MFITQHLSALTKCSTKKHDKTQVTLNVRCLCIPSCFSKSDELSIISISIGMQRPIFLLRDSRINEITCLLLWTKTSFINAKDNIYINRKNSNFEKSQHLSEQSTITIAIVISWKTSILENTHWLHVPWKEC